MRAERLSLLALFLSLFSSKSRVISGLSVDFSVDIFELFVDASDLVHVSGRKSTRREPVSLCYQTGQTSVKEFRFFSLLFTSHK